MRLPDWLKIRHRRREDPELLEQRVRHDRTIDRANSAVKAVDDRVASDFREFEREVRK